MLTIQRIGNSYSCVQDDRCVEAVVSFGLLIKDGEAVPLSEFALRIERSSSHECAKPIADGLYAVEFEQLRRKTARSDEIFAGLMEFCIDHFQHFDAYPHEFVFEHEEWRKDVVVDVLALPQSGGLTEDEMNYIERQALRRRIVEARKIWSDLAEIPTDEDGNLEQEFLSHPAGTDRETVWHSIEAKFPGVSVATDLMGLESQNINRIG